MRPQKELKKSALSTPRRGRDGLGIKIQADIRLLRLPDELSAPRRGIVHGEKNPFFVVLGASFFSSLNPNPRLDSAHLATIKNPF
jgi:hypothetical protein